MAILAVLNMGVCPRGGTIRTPLGYYVLMIHIKLLAYLFHITNVMLLFVVLNIVDNGCISWSRLLL